MTLRNIIRAWSDPAYRASLNDAERAQLPENPAGMIELTGTDLDFVAGGGGKAGHKRRKKSTKKSTKSSRSKKSRKSSKSSRSKKSRGSC